MEPPCGCDRCCTAQLCSAGAILSEAQPLSLILISQRELSYKLKEERVVPGDGLEYI